MKIDGSIAVVTGGARGIGKAFTKALLLNKAKVIRFYYSLSSLIFRHVYNYVKEVALLELQLNP